MRLAIGSDHAGWRIGLFEDLLKTLRVFAKVFSMTAPL